MSQEPLIHRNVILRVRRQDRPSAPARWEEFAVPYRPKSNRLAIGFRAELGTYRVPANRLVPS